MKHPAFGEQWSCYNPMSANIFSTVVLIRAEGLILAVFGPTEPPLCSHSVLQYITNTTTHIATHNSINNSQTHTGRCVTKLSWPRWLTAPLSQPIVSLYIRDEGVSLFPFLLTTSSGLQMKMSSSFSSSSFSIQNVCPSNVITIYNNSHQLQNGAEVTSQTKGQ